MRGMVVVKKGQVRDLGSMLVLGLVIWDRPLSPFPIKEEQNYPVPAALLLHDTETGEGEEGISLAHPSTL